MKATLLISVLLIYFNASAGSLNFGKKKDSLACLQIEGKITNADEGIDGECVVELVEANEIVQTVTLKEGKRQFKFILNKNSHYGIRIVKNGYISKLISVETEMLGESGNFGMFRFLFETSLMSELVKKHLNSDMLDFPIAIIRFDYELGTFSYDKKYTSYIKRELYNKNGDRQNGNARILPDLAAIEN